MQLKSNVKFKSLNLCINVHTLYSIQSTDVMVGRAFHENLEVWSNCSQDGAIYIHLFLKREILTNALIHLCEHVSFHWIIWFLHNYLCMCLYVLQAIICMVLLKEFSEKCSDVMIGHHQTIHPLILFSVPFYREQKISSICLRNVINWILFPFFSFSFQVSEIQFPCGIFSYPSIGPTKCHKYIIDVYLYIRWPWKCVYPRTVICVRSDIWG